MRLDVLRVEQLTPAMRRIVLGGDQLAGFCSPSPDDHIKLIFPTADGVDRRDYTPRHHDEEAGELTIDFALHDAGPATTWALSARSGDKLQLGGPRGSLLVPEDYDWWLLIGDETALPAIGRRVEELPSGIRVMTVVAITGPEEEQSWVTVASHSAIWVHRPGFMAADPEPLLEVVRTLKLPSGDGFIWIAAEAQVVRGMRAFVRQGQRTRFAA